MGLLDKVKKGVEKAREGASDLAQTTKIKMEIGKLNGHRAEVISEIGRQVYALHGQGRAVPEVEALSQEVGKIDVQVKALEAEIERVQREG